MTDLTFLKALRDKLKGGNIRSIHLNALPGRFATRLDFAHLNYIKDDFSKSFLDSLLTKSSFEFKITFDGMDLNSLSSEEQKRLGLLSKRLNSLDIENKDNYAEHGIKTFGFGYPLLIKPSKQDPSKIIKAPLFIWQLEIVKSTNKVNTWAIVRNKVRNEKGNFVEQDIHSVGLNDVLLSFLKTDENIFIPQINDDLLDDSIIDKKELIDVCYNVLKNLNANYAESIIESLQSKFNEPITAIPESSSLESISSNKPWIYFGGVFGLYRTQKESIITDIDKIIDRIDDFAFDELVIEDFNGTTLSAVETDPSQQEILNSLGTEPKKIIQGPPGTGKSQSLTALITNALANNLKVLVVCEKKTALDVIKNNLNKESEQLGSLVALIEDINKDRDGIVNSVRDSNANLKNSSFNQSNYKVAKQNLEKTINDINVQHKELDKKIYLGKSWTELVGTYLKLEKKTNKSKLLDAKLKHTDFEKHKDENELPIILSKISEAKHLFKEIKTLNHPLWTIDKKHFLEDNPRAKQLKITQDVIEYLKGIESLKTTIEEEKKRYYTALDEHYNGHYELIKSLAESLTGRFDLNRKLYKNNFSKDNYLINVKVNLLSVFSSKFKKIKDEKNALVNLYQNLTQQVQEWNYIKHSFMNDFDVIKDNELFYDDIKKLIESIERWNTDLITNRKKYYDNYSSKNIHSIYKSNKRTFEELEKKGVDLVNKINDDGIMTTCFLIEDNLLNELSNKATEILESLNVIQQNLEKFIPYYYWQRFFINLSAIQQKTIEALIEIECDNWEITFECWYYYWLLAYHENENLPKNDDKIQELYESKEQLKNLQIRSIIDNWTKRQIKSSNSSQSKGINPIGLFNKRGGRGERRNSLRKIINSDFELFTDFFPVVMVSPSVCSSIIPLEEGIFDLVIFDEASQLRLEDTFSSLIRGKIKVVSGDSQQMPPSSYFQGGSTLLNPTEEDLEEEQTTQDILNSQRQINSSLDLADSESLLVYAENCNYKQSYLKVHYRSQHPQLIDFSNHAFYGKRLIPMPEKMEYKPIQYIEVNGIYEDSVNRDEARQVVDILLNHIKPFVNGKYPSVGVATFNLYQRNLILEEITKARQQNPENDKKIADLGADLFVKNLENIQGDERDIIILSTTFGKKPSGSFGQQFGPITNKSKGYKLLNVIITRAKFKIFVCTSIPNEAIMQYSNLLKSGFGGNAILYSYLAYAKAISNSNLDQAKQILNEIHDSSPHKFFSTDGIDLGSESPFEEEVYNRLAEKIGKDRLQQQHKIGGYRIDLVVKSKVTGKPIIAIECDGAKYHGSAEAYAWDMFRESVIKPYGFTFYRIWSTNWWDSPEKELTKTIDFILQIDSIEKQELVTPHEELFNEEIIIPIAQRPETKRRVDMNSIVTIKNPEGKISRVKLSRNQNQSSLKPDKDGVLSIYEKAPLALSIIGRTEGEVCQYGLLELYYEILKVE